MKTYVCQVCKHIAFNGAPVDCPVCGAAIENFENVPDAVKKPADGDNLTEAEKKHIPKVLISGECSLDHADKCTGVRIKIGDIEHVMEAEHFITFIDIYINEKYMTRVNLTPQKIHPSAELHLITTSGELTVIANCNVHGNWMTRINLARND
jgi:superoxide reductase